eukprot:jgi/Botrbrau1/21969/Bobra.0249s0092.2
MQPVCLTTENLKEARKNAWLRRTDLDDFWNVYLVFDDGTKLLCSSPDLATVSPYFKSKFGNPHLQSHTLHVKDVEGHVMEAMVAAQYLDQLALTDDNISIFVSAAERFRFHRITKMCQQYLVGTVTASSAIKYLMLYATISSSCLLL